MVNEAKLLAVFSVGLMQAACAAVTLSVNEARTRADVGFDPADWNRTAHVVFAASDFGEDWESWPNQVAVSVPAGESTSVAVALPANFADEGLVTRVFLERKATTDDYVQSGLVALYDGISNAGAGVHDGAATEWVDLVGGKNLALVEGDSVGTDFVRIGPSVHKTADLVSAAGSMTMEFGARVVSSGLASGDTAPFFGVPVNGMVRWEKRANLRPLAFACGVYLRWSNNTYETLDAWKTSGNFLYCSFTPATYHYETGADASGPNRENVVSLIDGEQKLRQWSVSDYGGITAGTDKCLTLGHADGSVEMRTVRIYNRTLTLDEQRHNYRVDCARFEGTTLLYETATVYAPIPFSVEKVTKEDGLPVAVTARFTGSGKPRALYVAWAKKDAGARFLDWTNVCRLGTVAAGAAKVTVELPVEIREALSLVGYRLFLERAPIVQDYVQEGLLAHFDGLDNAGAGVHDGAATEWVDLVGGKNLALVEGDSVGTDFVRIGPSVHKTADLVSAAGSMTMEFGARVVSSGLASGDTAPFFGVPVNGMVRWEKRANLRPLAFACGVYLRWSNNTYETLDAWKTSGNFLYCSFTPAIYHYETGADASGPNRENVVSLIDGEQKLRQWNVTDYGGITAGTDKCLTLGHADGSVEMRTVRIYNRTLTLDEQVHNYRVDRARFEGDEIEMVSGESTPFAPMTVKGMAIVIR